MLAVLAGGALLFLAVPLAVAAFLALPGDTVMKRVQAGEAIGTDDAATLAASRRRVLAWSDPAAAWSELAFAELRLAWDRRTADGRPDPALTERALRATEQALRRAPADSESWMRLAFMRYAGEGANPAAARALALAFMTGPVRPKQVGYRLDLAFRLWPSLSPDERRLAMQFLRRSWPYGYDEILRVANTPARLGIVRAAFAADPATLATFEALNARRTPHAD